MKQLAQNRNISVSSIFVVLWTPCSFQQAANISHDLSVLPHQPEAFYNPNSDLWIDYPPFASGVISNRIIFSLCVTAGYFENQENGSRETTLISSWHKSTSFELTVDIEDSHCGSDMNRNRRNSPQTFIRYLWKWTFVAYLGSLLGQTTRWILAQL